MSFDIPSRWTFESESVAQNFDDHVREQLPWYDLTTGAVAHIARHYMTSDSVVYDIGASTGNITRALSETVKERQARMIAVEPVEAMCERLRVLPDVEVAQQRVEDVTFDQFSVAVLNLTLQFVEPAKRQDVIDALKRARKADGVIIVVDKIETVGGYSKTILQRLTLAGKLAQGAKPEAIIAKELSLGGVQRALDAKHFDDWTEFFRFGEFAGYFYEGAN